MAAHCRDYEKSIEVMCSMSELGVSISLEEYRLLTSTEWDCAPDAASKSSLLAIAEVLAPKHLLAKELSKPNQQHPLTLRGPALQFFSGRTSAPRCGSVADKIVKEKAINGVSYVRAPEAGGFSLGLPTYQEGCARSKNLTRHSNPSLDVTSKVKLQGEIIFDASLGLDVSLEKLCCPECGTTHSEAYVSENWPMHSEFEYTIPCRAAACTPIPSLIPGGPFRRHRLLPRLCIVFETGSKTILAEWLPPLALRREVRGVLSRSPSTWTKGFADASPGVFFSMLHFFAGEGLPTFFLKLLI